MQYLIYEEILEKIKSLLTESVSLKEYIFKYINDLHPLNIWSIYLTYEVSKLDSSKYNKFEQP